MTASQRTAQEETRVHREVPKRGKGAKTEDPRDKRKRKKLGHPNKEKTGRRGGRGIVGWKRLKNKLQKWRGRGLGKKKFYEGEWDKEGANYLPETERKGGTPEYYGTLKGCDWNLGGRGDWDLIKGNSRGGDQGMKVVAKEKGGRENFSI